jgi:hypothetical protein
MRAGGRIVLAGLAMLVTAPAAADVKAGTDAWARGDWKAAVEQWRGPAIAGDPDAQFNMGQAYKLGRGVPTDMAQAESWYAKAAAQGHPRAEDNYGLALFQDGHKTEALPWLEKAVTRDEARAELVLGTMLFNGDAVPRDWPRAYALITRSSQQGLAPASQTLAQMDSYMSPEQRQQGTQLAGQIAATASTASVSVRSLHPVAIASTDPRPARGPASAPTVAPATKPTAATATSKPRPSPAPRPSPKPVASPKPAPVAAKPTAGGHWRIQLGAFRDAANAKALWGRVGGKTGGAPIYAAANGVTRLQAGPFASKADAARACKASGVACDVVPSP